MGKGGPFFLMERTVTEAPVSYQLCRAQVIFSPFGNISGMKNLYRKKVPLYFSLSFSCAY